MAAQTKPYDKCTEALTKSQYATLVKEFAAWYDDGGWDTDGLHDEFGDEDDKEESGFVEWIKDKEIVETDSERFKIWYILHHAITLTKSESVDDNHQMVDNQSSDDSKEASSLPVSVVISNVPSHPSSSSSTPIQLNLSDSIIVKMMTTDISEKERKKNVMDSKSPLKKKIKKQAPLMLPAASNSGGFFSKKGKKDKKDKQKKDKKDKKDKKGGGNNNAQDILHVEFIGYKNDNYPLLIHFVDAAVRCQMNEWIKKGKKSGSNSKISTNDFFDQYCNHPAFKDYLKSKSAIDKMELVKTAIDSYQHRILPPFQLMEPIWKIKGNPLDLCNYMFEMARIARNSANQPIHSYASIIPIQIEFLILNDKIIDARPRAGTCQGVDALFDDHPEDKEDSDDSDDEYGDGDEDDREVIPKDIDQLLKSKKIKPIVYDNPLREMLRCTEDIKRVVENKRCKRTVFILDRRDNKNKDSHSGGTEGDKLYLFKPVEHNKFEDDDHERIHGALHYASIKSMVPRPSSSKEKKDDW
eukprot:CAMPEP_0201575292 /NCGR_PEP_ID=MMETSP0190_2-20130828/20400_1 /ASSEMBLY_ACC=CAM_ASM_000263 /TAXON_ID=37353 /ORGANISM="Rosalina sp." /LENGTH=524 /DNA_ID=CAMNT_0048004721 /DNA_START=59 /DNA_END=1630 /DNA_ORIENTATION=+